MSLGQSCALLRWPFADMCAMANVFAGMPNFLDGLKRHAPWFAYQRIHCGGIRAARNFYPNSVPYS